MSTIRNPDELYGLLMRVGEPQRFAAGEVIFEKGDRGDRMCVVRESSAELVDMGRGNFGCWCTRRRDSPTW